MKVVIEQAELNENPLTYQDRTKTYIRCRKCKSEHMLLMLQIDDDMSEIRKQREHLPIEDLSSVKVWPHDALVVNVYLCTNCGAMRVNWNQA